MNERSQRCGNCEFYDAKIKVCRSPFHYNIPKGRLPLGIKLERVKMEPSDGEGCKFWLLDTLSWKRPETPA